MNKCYELPDAVNDKWRQNSCMQFLDTGIYFPAIITNLVLDARVRINESIVCPTTTKNVKNRPNFIDKKICPFKSFLI